MSRHIETPAHETQRLGLGGRVAGSHLTSIHSMDNYHASKLLPLIAEAGVHCVPNPVANIVLQGRHDGYPKRRGLMRVPELMALGVTVAFGQDSMLDVASMAVHVGHMTSLAAMKDSFDAVAMNAAEVFGLPDYGIAVGNHADFVLLEARDAVEAIRLRAARLAVIRRGRIIAQSAPRTATLALEGRPVAVEPWRYAPADAH